MQANFDMFTVLVHLLFMVSLILGAHTSANQCRNLFKGLHLEPKQIKPTGEEIQLLEKHLFESLHVQIGTHQSQSPSVKVVEVNDTEIKLERQAGRPWYSSARLVPNQPLSNQGDVFNPVILFGAKLAAYLGFRIEKAVTGEPILVVPNAKSIKKKIRQLNSKLNANQLEEIAFQPISIGYIQGIQMLKLSIGGPDGVDLQFPFSDQDIRTAPHEVSFHLVGLLLPKAVLKRTKAVSIRTLQLADMLQDPKYNLGEWGRQVAEQLIHDRNLDLDLGTGNLTADLAYYRRVSKMQNYAAKAGQNYADESNMISDMILLARPTMPPSQVAIERLVRMAEMDINSENLKGGPLKGNFFHPLETLTRANLLSQTEKKIPAKMADLARIENLIKDFMRAHRAEDSDQFAAYEDPSTLSTEFMKGLDSRIALFIRLLE